MSKSKSRPFDEQGREGDFSTLVSTLISVFTTGLDIVSKLRGRRRRRKQRAEPAVEAAEIELRKSLSRAPPEIGNGYRGGIRGLGGRFEGGDGQAHASITHTLLRLNHGLVDIISRFLASGKDGKDVDYRSFTRLSDSSRAEAVGALGDLYQRLSQSSINLRRQNIPHAKRDGRALKEIGMNHAKKNRRRPEMPRKGSSGKEYPNGALILSKNGSLAEVVSSKSRSSSTSGPLVLKDLSNLPQGSRKVSQQSPGLPAQQWPVQGPSTPSPPRAEIRPELSPPVNAREPPAQHNEHRQSFYSFASDSTKLGEIPQHLWPQPWHPDSAREEPVPHWANSLPVEADTRREKKGKGLWGLFKRGGVPVVG